MKHSLLAVIFLLGLLGCGSEEESPKTPEELIKGKWNVVQEKHVYFNLSGDILYQTSGSGILGVGTMDISDQHVSQNHSTGSLISGTYTISENGGKKSISITDGASLREFQLDTVSKSSMTWMRETPGGAYYEGGTMYPVFKTRLYIGFTRR